MDLLQFLGKVLPATGVFFAATPRDNRGYTHYQATSLTGLEMVVQQLEHEQRTVYYALASFREPYIMVPGKDGQARRRYRVKENVDSLKAFWLDLDVGQFVAGQTPKYPSQVAAVEGLGAFLKDTGLPTPMLVSSGYGVHVYWPLTEPIPMSTWQKTADALKRLCAKLQLICDPMRTSDPASVLRPIGTTNRKNNGAAPVELVSDADPIRHIAFDSLVMAACTKFAVPEPTARPSDTMRRINDEFLVSNDRNLPPSNHDIVANKCLQIRAMRDTRGCIPEPLWYASLQVLRHTVGGRDICHEWSKGYEGYSESETDLKLDNLEERGYGPALCSTFEGRNPGGCESCPHRGKISSPIQLGVVLDVPKEPELVEHRTETGAPDGTKYELPTELGPFKRAKSGLFIEVDEVPLKFYDYDIYPVAIIHDEHHGGEQVLVRHYLPHEGWGEFKFDSSELADLRAFSKAMLNNHVQPYLSGKHADYLRGYMDAYIRRLREQARMHRLVPSMGWKPDLDWSFVLGTKIYRPNGAVEDIGASARMGGTEKLIAQAGDPEQWRALTEHLNQPGMEAHAFAFCTAFAGPIVPFTQFAGALISMRGETNIGKSTIAQLASSVYGKPNCNWLSPKDTEFRAYARLGILNNVPAYIDEMTVFSDELISNVIYAAANGAPRGRLKTDGSLAETQTWSTSLLMSLNGSVYDKLDAGNGGGDSEAEKVRVLEFTVPRVDSFAGAATDIVRTLSDTYGHAGPAFVQWLVAHRAEITPMVREAYDLLVEAVGDSRPRFMIAAAAATLVGAKIAYDLGLIRVDPMRLAPFAVEAIRAAMKRIDSTKQTPLGLLAEFLNANIASRLAVERLSASVSGTTYRAVKLPMGGAGLTQRLDVTEKKVWIYSKTWRAFCTKQRLDPDLVIKELVALGAVSAVDVKVTLGRYIPGFGGDQVRCIEVDLNRKGLEDFTKVEEELDNGK